MKMKLTAALAGAALLLVSATAVLAQKAADPLQSQLEARKVVMVQGRERLVDAGSARPGDVIEYTATYRNAGKLAITGLQSTLPIPPQTEFIPGSARPAQAKASLDGRVFADIPLKRTVEREGRRVEELVPYREYRALRWSAGALGGENSTAFTARVRVIEDPVPGTASTTGSAK